MVLRERSWGSRAALGALFDERFLFFLGGKRVGEQYGIALATGNFEGTGGPDQLAVGIPGRAVGSISGAGAVEVISSRGGWHHIEYVANTPRVGDAFGSALTVGNFNQRDAEDLAVGIPGRDVAGVTDAGAVAAL